MNAKQKKALAAALLHLKAICEASAANENTGFLYTEAAIHKPLVDAGFVVINTAMTDTEGKVATRATDEGVAELAKLEASPAAEAAPAKPVFTLEDAVAIPEVKKGGAIRTSQYPFDAMQPGQSFFVAATADRPDPAKSLASTVSGATRKYSVPKKNAETGVVEMRINRKKKEVPVLVAEREFTIRAVEEDGVKGARIWRTK